MSIVTIRGSFGGVLRTCVSKNNKSRPCQITTTSSSNFRSSFRHPSRRRFSSTFSGAGGGGSAPVHAAPTAAVAPLTAITSELDRLSPRFEVSASQISIIRTPAEFYETLKTKIRSAKRRIFLATLYIGNSEYELISCLREALLANPDLKVSILTDALRSTRETPKPSCASLLIPLVSEFGEERVDIRMFHTPNLTGLKKRVVPKRINEGWGLQHMKLYGMDDEIILSGANLSTDYFTNRQDRYHVINSSEVTDYFSRVHESISQLSFKVRPVSSKGIEYTSTWEPTNKAPSPLDDPDAFVSSSSKFLSSLTLPSLPPSRTANVNSATAVLSTTDERSTFVYPLLQLTSLMTPSTDKSNELPTLRRLFTLLASSSQFKNHRWVFTAGYFNMTPEFRTLLLNTYPASGTVIAASPWANGFYGSKGFSGMLPAAYTLLARRFIEAVTKAGLDSTISLHEWRKGTVNQPDGWTYHAKGFWLTAPTPTSEPTIAPAGPCLTVVGSSNYTKRSHTLDIEANAMIVTADKDLQRRLAEEVAWLKEYATPVTLQEFQRVERRVSPLVRIAMWIVNALGGAL